MSHEIATTADGRSAIAYVGDTPWHRLGTELEEGVGIDAWARAAGLDFTVEEAPASFYGEATGLVQVPGRKVLFRGDTGDPLEVVSDRYKPVQTREVLEFYRDLTERHGYELDVAGVLKGGRKVWALARTPEHIQVAGDDLRNFVLLATSYDAGMSTVASNTWVRVVCDNTLQAAVGPQGKAADVQIPHVAAFNADRVKGQLGLTAEHARAFKAEAERLAQARVDRDAAARFFAQVLWPRAENMPEQKAVNRRLEEMMALYENGVGQLTPAAAHTAWGLVNAVTRYVDHGGRSRSDDRRADSAAFGNGARQKKDAWMAALELAEAA